MKVDDIFYRAISLEETFDLQPLFLRLLAPRKPNGAALRGPGMARRAASVPSCDAAPLETVFAWAVTLRPRPPASGAGRANGRRELAGKFWKSAFVLFRPPFPSSPAGRQRALVNLTFPVSRHLPGNGLPETEANSRGQTAQPPGRLLLPRCSVPCAQHAPKVTICGKAVALSFSLASV